MPEFYSPTATLYHYLSMAKGNYREYLKREKVRVKKYFYVLRPILACMWIEEYKTMPPMQFERLLTKLNLKENVASEIQKLLARKKSGEELDFDNRIEILNTFLEEKIRHFDKHIKKPSKQRQLNNTILDQLFREIIKTKQSSPNKI